MSHIKSLRYARNRTDLQNITAPIILCCLLDGIDIRHNMGGPKKMTPRHILVHHVFNLTIYLLIFWVMSDDTIVSPNDKQWSVSQCFWCVKRLFEVCSYVKI